MTWTIASRTSVLLLAVMLSGSPVWGQATQPATPAKEAPTAKEPLLKKAGEWMPLFDGKSLENWGKSDFGGEGEVTVAEGVMKIEDGQPLSGVTWKGKSLPTSNYEVKVDCMRFDGSDFFCGLTFPVKKDPCSLILGGWGGSVVGLSSIDGYDASENGTTTSKIFDNKKWYRVRLRVTDSHIFTWIDAERVITQELDGKKISIRLEVEPSKPFGFSCFRSVSHLKNFQIRLLNDAEIKDADPKLTEDAKK